MTDTTESSFPSTERFLIQECLGAGGFGAVYRAFDKEQNTLVALKTFTELEAEALYAFKQEFRSLADVTHPNLVELYELFFDKDQWFFTMELVEGVNILDYICQPLAEEDLWRGITQEVSSSLNSLDTPIPDLEPSWKTKAASANAETISDSKINPITKRLKSPARFDRLRRVLKQLVEGLNALHEAGKLHRDIKPSNVLVTKQERVVILDFGLVTEVTGQKSGKVKTIVGTPTYMSPEQGAGQVVTEATDWYSMGVVLYEALTGQAPFVDSFDPNPMRILLNKLKYEPTPPSQIATSIPQDLEKLCLDLLSCDPIKRPNAIEILRRLTGVETKQKRKLIADQARLIGREEQLDILQKTFLSVKAGKTMAVYIHGQSGMGKSAFIRYFLDKLQSQEPELIILTGRCYEHEFVPYKALDSLMDSLASYLSDLTRREKASIIPKDINALARIFPVFNQISEISEASGELLDQLNFQQLRQRAFIALRDLLIQLGKEKSLVLYVDDLQWGDSDSAILLQEILRIPNAPRLLFLASYRSEDALGSELLKILLHEDVDMLAEKQEIELKALSSEEAYKLAKILLDDMSKEQAEIIAAEAGGSPFFISEFVRYSQQGHNFTHTTAERTVKNGLSSLDEVIQRNIQELPETARNLLEIIAIAGQPIDRKIAKQAANIKDEDQVVVINVLRANRLVRAKASKQHYELELYHNRIKEAIVKSLASQTIESHHANLALALEELSGDDPQWLAYHFSCAGNNAKAIKYIILAAEEACHTLAFNQAVQFYQKALELVAKSSELENLSLGIQKQDLEIKLADSLAFAGRSREAAEIYIAIADEICNLCITDNVALKFQQRAAEELFRCGHIDEGLEVLSSVLNKVGIKVPTMRWQSLLSFVFRRLWIQLRGLETKEVTADKIALDTLLQIDICWTGAIGLSLVDSMLGADFQTRHLLLALKIGEPYRLARALTLEIPYSAIDGARDWTKTNQLIEKVKSLAEKLNDPYLVTLVNFSACVAAFLMGDWKKAHELGELSEKMLRERSSGVSWELSTVVIFMLRPLFYMGQWDKLFDRVTALIQEAQRCGDLYTETNLRVRLYYLMRLASDEPEKLEVELREALEQWSHRGFHVQHYWELVCQVETTMYRGEGEEGWIFLNYRWREMKKAQFLRVQFVRIEMYHLHARSALSAIMSGADKHTLLKAAEKDVIKLEGEKRTYGDALALSIKAAIAAIREEKDLAIKFLIEAEEKFTLADMELFATAARYRRGQLILDKNLMQACCQWMKKQYIKCPEKMFDMVAPGLWEN